MRKQYVVYHSFPDSIRPDQESDLILIVSGLLVDRIMGKFYEDLKVCELEMSINDEYYIADISDSLVMRAMTHMGKKIFDGLVHRCRLLDLLDTFRYRMGYVPDKFTETIYIDIYLNSNNAVIIEVED